MRRWTGKWSAMQTMSDREENGDYLERSSCAAMVERGVGVRPRAPVKCLETDSTVPKGSTLFSRQIQTIGTIGLSH